MALTDIQIIRLEIGLVNDNADLLSDDDIQYFIDSSVDLNAAMERAASAALFSLTTMVNSRIGNELTMFDSQRYKQYAEHLRWFLSERRRRAVTIGGCFYGGVTE